jgi:hypothetical protein
VLKSKEIKACGGLEAAKKVLIALLGENLEEKNMIKRIKYSAKKK